MNEYIETLNHWGEVYWGFAWPMLWQSSLLIAVVFAFDFVSARRIRASVRYALWLVVLVKLILPPSLALPTGATWWLWRTQPMVEAPAIQNYTVSFDDTRIPDTFAPSTVPVVLPPPKLSGEAWMLMAVVAMAIGLLLWLVFRWLGVAGEVRRSIDASSELDGILDEAWKLAGLRRHPRLKLIDETQSPAVYGLFRPVILLPRVLASRLSVCQLRAVLLHEAMHLRRGDVWVNCVQTLLQIAYWWHPLVWIANARLRRVREEAVDDAVMLALRDGAEAYAPTLLEVAKFAFRRPLASLGLVGILESRSALRQRVERLTDFRPPRRAGITFLSLCGIFAFCAVALPMGQGPAELADSFSSDESTKDMNLTLDVNPDVFIRNIKARASWTMVRDTNDYSSILFDILENEGVDCAPPHGFSFNSSTEEISTRNSPEELEIFRRVIEELNRPDGKWNLQLTNRPVRKNILIEGDFFWMTGDHFKNLIAGATYHSRRGGAAPCWTADPAQLEVINQRIDSLGLRPVRRARIQTTEGCIAELSVGDATNSYRLKCDPYLYDGKIVLACKAGSEFMSNSRTVTAFTVWGVNSKQSLDNGGGIVLRKSSPDGSSNFVVILHARIVSSTARAAAAIPELEMRTFNVGTNLFFANLRKITGSQISGSYTNVSALLTEFFEKAGVDLSPPKTIFFHHGPRAGIFFVYATPQDMDVIQRIVETLRDPHGGDSRWLKSINSHATGKNVTDADFGQFLDDPLAGGKIFTTPPSHFVQATGLEIRTFKVNPSVFFANLDKGIRSFYPVDTPTVADNVVPRLQRFLLTRDVDLGPPKELFYNDGLGVIFVSATPQDLDIIEKAIQALSDYPPQLHIKARFIEVPSEFFSSADANALPPGMTNGGVLTATEMKNVWSLLSSQPGSEDLAEPEATTISGRQIQMRATISQDVITNFTLEPLGGAAAGSKLVPQSERVETGSILDVVPDQLGDSYTINLTAVATQIDFLGYRTSNGLVRNVASNAAGTGVSPAFQVRDASLSRNLWDQQTLVLFPKAKAGWSHVWGEKDKEWNSEVVGTTEENGSKVLVVLTTATMLDAAGNRIHSDYELPFAQNNVPVQSR